MTPSQQRAKFERITRRLERKYNVIIRRVIFSQLQTYANAIRKNTLDAIYSIDKYFPTDQLERAYENMIIEAFESFRMDNPEDIIKAIDTSVWTTLVTQYITNVGGNRITQINRYTKAYVLSKLRPILNQGIEEGKGIADIATNIIKDIGEYAGKFARYRAERIARTEIIGSSNEAGLASVKAAGIEDQVLKFWMPEIDERTRSTHIEMNNHPAIPLNEDFDVPKMDGTTEKLAYPGDPKGSAENVINCRCSIGYRRIR